MPTEYMLFWSIIMVVAIGIWRVQQWSDLIFVTVVTLLVVVISHTLFIQLAIAANLDPSLALQKPSSFVFAGPYGWLALLVMPCGWLGPIIGLNLLQRRNWHMQ